MIARLREALHRLLVWTRPLWLVYFLYVLVRSSQAFARRYPRVREFLEEVHSWI